MELYRVESLTFTYPGQFAPALRDVSLTLCAGEFVTLCGLSGSGKARSFASSRPRSRPTAFVRARSS